MDYEQIRTLLHETIRTMLERVKGNQSDIGQFSQSMQVVSLVGRVEDLARKQGHISDSERLNTQQQCYVVQALWELIIQGVLVPISVRNADQGWPFVSFTDHGEKVILEEWPTPYDPSNYLGQFDSTSHDEVMMFYLEEALGCFHANRYAASTVMLGVAAERIFDLLLAAFIDALASDKQRERLSKGASNRPITTRYNELKKRLDSKKSQLPASLTESLDTCLVSIFNLVRHHRNDTGHPTGRKMTRDEAYANLYVFPHFCNEMYQLIEHLKANPQSLQ